VSGHGDAVLSAGELGHVRMGSGCYGAFGRSLETASTLLIRPSGHPNINTRVLTPSSPGRPHGPNWTYP